MVLIRPFGQAARSGRGLTTKDGVPENMGAHTNTRKKRRALERGINRETVVITVPSPTTEDLRHQVYKGMLSKCHIQTLSIWDKCNRICTIRESEEPHRCIRPNLHMLQDKEVQISEEASILPMARISPPAKCSKA